MKNFIIFLIIAISFSVNFIFAQTIIPSSIVKDLNQSYQDERRYNEVCFLTAHNAYSSYKEGWTKYLQQTLSLEEQFAYGVRSFMIDLYWYQIDGDSKPYIALCHQLSPPSKGAQRTAAKQNCTLTRKLRKDATPTPAYDFFVKIRRWLDEDPKAIITVHLESYLGPFEDGEFNFWDVLTEANVTRYVYLPHAKYLELTNLSKATLPSLILGPKEWPTLGELRKANKRLIIFSDNVGSKEDENAGDSVISTRVYRETKYDLKKYPQAEMRTDRRGQPRGKIAEKGLSQLLVMNHFYEITVPGHYSVINSCEAIFKRVNLCYEQENRLPNFIAVDFVEEGFDGGARQAVLLLNSRPPQDFSSFNGPILPETPFPPIDRWNWAIYWIKSSINSLETTIIDNPWSSIGAAAALGTAGAGVAFYRYRNGVKLKDA